MSINITTSNGTISVATDDNVPRTYFGAIGASGKFYPSGTSGAIVDGGWTIVSNTTDGLSDGDYEDRASTTNSTSGTPDVLFNVQIVSGVITLITLSGSETPSFGSGYAIGDRFTIQASDIGGGTGEVVLQLNQLDIDGFLIVIGGDHYEVKWYNLVINGTSPTDLANAQELLASLFSSAGTGYKVYTALLSQSSEGDFTPTAEVLANTLGTIEYTWDSTGFYFLNLDTFAAWDEQKTFISVAPSYTAVPYFAYGGIYSGDNSYIALQFLDITGDAIDIDGSGVPLEIRVYN